MHIDKDLKCNYCVTVMFIITKTQNAKMTGSENFIIVMMFTSP